MKTFDLQPTDGRASFYNKCRVEQEDTMSYLYSYNTKVAHYNHETNEIIINNMQSMTTIRHINAFLHFYGFDTMNKKEMTNHVKNQ